MDSPAHGYARVSMALAGTPFEDIAYVDETDSTNADAAALLGDPRHAGTSIVAEHQTAGRGRRNREWIDVAGSALLVTTILPVPVPAESLWAIPFWAGLSLQIALRDAGVRATLRWPNDLLLDGQKLAGILCVSRVSGPSAWVACGVGVNVRRPPGLPAIEPAPAFCDDAIAVDRAELLRRLLQNYAESLSLLSQPKSVAERWERASDIAGSCYAVLEDGAVEPFEATAIGLSDDGGLKVERNGAVRTVALGDARVLR
ncbi:MAG TPA: biotin--[acetyl-CoA-carboxylase] ligase [Candidatus Tumulicola sp.]|jgi:BirA family biotin operon repressor/biotin-[acetyl-CoA-carboxylase] ligase